MGAAGLGTTLITYGATGAGGLARSRFCWQPHGHLEDEEDGHRQQQRAVRPAGQATIPWRVSVATATFAGSYTGPGYNFVVNANINYDPPVTTTTTRRHHHDHCGSDHDDDDCAAGDEDLHLRRHPAAGLVTGAVEEPLPRPGGDRKVSAPAGAFAGPGSAFVLQCNPDPAIPTDGSGCNVGGLAVGPIGGDGSMASTDVVIKTGAVGSDPRSVCPPTQVQADAGVVNCLIAAAPGGDSTKALPRPSPWPARPSSFRSIRPATRPRRPPPLPAAAAVTSRCSAPRPSPR